MKWKCALQTLALLLACVATTGYVILTETDPPKGSIIAGFENEGNLTVFCVVFESYVPANESIQQITLWFLEDPDDPDSLSTINVGEDPRFLITGDRVHNTSLFFNTNLTITNLTADLDRLFLHCGIPGNERAATFTLRIYLPPSAPSQVLVSPENINPTFIHICWQASIDMGTPPLSFYRVYVQPSGMVLQTENTVPNLNVTGLLPGTDYEFTVTAVSVSGDVEGESDPSPPGHATTTTTVPAPVCDSPPVSMNGVITISWSYVHTGGLNLTLVYVQYEEVAQDVFNAESQTLEDLSDTSIQFMGLEAGSFYLFQIIATNALGDDSVICPPVLHAIGVPRAPEILNITTPSPGVVVLTVLTTEAGVDPNSPFTFDVNATVTGSDPALYPFTFNNYIDNTERDLRIDTLESGSYLFSVRSRNSVGASMFVDFDGLVNVKERSKVIFQLVLTGVRDCAQWVQQNVLDKLEDVTTSVQENVEQLCTCGFTTDDITDSAFECSKIDADIVTFRAVLHAVDTVEYIEQWREEGPAINVQGLILRVSYDSSCPVVIDSFTDPLCEPTQTSSSEDDSPGAVIGGVMAGVVVLAVCVAVVIIVAIIITRRRNHSGAKSRKSGLEMSAGPTGEAVYEEIDQETPIHMPTVDYETGVTTTTNVAYAITTRDGHHKQQ